MKHIWTTVICGVICTVLTTGCWDIKELNNRAIVISSAVDLSSDGQILLTDQIANPEALGRTMESPKERFYTMAAEGHTILDAAQLMQTRLSRYIFIGHRRNIFIGQATAEHGLGDIVDEFTRSPDSRIRTDMSVVKAARGSDVLKIPSVVEKQPSIAALKSRTVVGGGQPGTTFVDFLLSSSSKTACPTLPLVEIESHPNDYLTGNGEEQLSFVGRAIFDKNLRMVGQIDYRETVYRFWEIGRLTHQTFAVKIPDSNQYVSVYTNHLKSKIVPTLQGRRLNVSVYLKGDGRIAESNTKLNLMKQSAVQTVHLAIDKQVSDEMLQLIKRVQEEYRTDIFGFDRACQIRYPMIFPTLVNQWPEIFSSATVHVYTDIRIKTVGEAGTPLYEHVEM